MTKSKGYLGLAAAVLLLGTGLSGCGKEPAVEPPPQANPFGGLPFVLTPDPNGNLQPRTPDGKPIAPIETPSVEQIKAIRNLSQVAVLQIEGSCYYLINIGGVWYKVPC